MDGLAHLIHICLLLVNPKRFVSYGFLAVFIINSYIRIFYNLVAVAVAGGESDYVGAFGQIFQIRDGEERFAVGFKVAAADKVSLPILHMSFVLEVEIGQGLQHRFRSGKVVVVAGAFVEIFRGSLQQADFIVQCCFLGFASQVGGFHGKSVLLAHLQLLGQVAFNDQAGVAHQNGGVGGVRLARDVGHIHGNLEAIERVVALRFQVGQRGELDTEVALFVGRHLAGGDLLCGTARVPPPAAPPRETGRAFHVVLDRSPADGVAGVCLYGAAYLHFLVCAELLLRLRHLHFKGGPFVLFHLNGGRSVVALDTESTIQSRCG